MRPPSVSTATITRLRPTRDGQPRQKRAVHLPSRNAALPTIIFSAPASRMLVRARRRANAAAHAHAHRRLAAQRAHQPRIASAPHRRVQIDHVQQRIFAKALQQAEDVVHRQPPLAPVHQLHRAPILQINARNNQGTLPISLERFTSALNY